MYRQTGNIGNIIEIFPVVNVVKFYQDNDVEEIDAEHEAEAEHESELEESFHLNCSEENILSD